MTLGVCCCIMYESKGLQQKLRGASYEFKDGVVSMAIIQKGNLIVKCSCANYNTLIYWIKLKCLPWFYQLGHVSRWTSLDYPGTIFLSHWLTIKWGENKLFKNHFKTYVKFLEMYVLYLCEFHMVLKNFQEKIKINDSKIPFKVIKYFPYILYTYEINLNHYYIKKYIYLKIFFKIQAFFFFFFYKYNHKYHYAFMDDTL